MLYCTFYTRKSDHLPISQKTKYVSYAEKNSVPFHQKCLCCAFYPSHTKMHRHREAIAIAISWKTSLMQWFAANQIPYAACGHTKIAQCYRRAFAMAMCVGTAKLLRLQCVSSATVSKRLHSHRIAIALSMRQQHSYSESRAKVLQMHCEGTANDSESTWQYISDLKKRTWYGVQYFLHISFQCWYITKYINFQSVLAGSRRHLLMSCIIENDRK